jgi:hypothetical protein
VIASVLRYILETTPAEPATVRALLVRQVGRKEAEKMLTAAEMLRREGEAHGKAEGKREALLVLLRQRFGRLPAAVGARIGKAGAAEVDAWFRRGITASSLDEVLAADAGVSSSKTMRPTRARSRSARRSTRG